MRYSHQMCPLFQHAVEVVGKRWTGLLLELLTERPLRFNELAERLEVVSDRMLSTRLKELESEGIVERLVYPETPVRVEYRLSQKGKALAPVLEALHDWSRAWVRQKPARPAATGRPARDPRRTARRRA